MSRKISVTECDILIVGGGSAGSMAAIRAKELAPEARVLVVEKNDAKYSGCIARGMDALNIVTIPGVTSPEKFLHCQRESCDGIVDEDVQYEMAKRTFPLMQKLISWGVLFPQDENGNYDIIQTHKKASYCVGMEEPELKALLHGKMKDLGVLIMNRTMAVELIKDAEGRTAGVVAINIRTGEVVVIKSRTVILTAGGTARFGLPNNGNLYGVYDYPGNTGDGYMIAYRAGAEVSGFEHTLSYVIVKDANAPLLYITLTRGATLLNGLGEIMDSKGVSTSAMLLEHQAGKSPLRIDMRHLKEEDIAFIERILFSTERPSTERFLAGRGINFRDSYIELWPTEIFLCGGHGMTGVRINPRAETTIPGLYAAGDNGMCVRCYLSGAFTIGEVAAENAVEYIRSGSAAEADMSSVDAFLNKLEQRSSHRNNRISIEEFEYKVRRTINDYLTPPKNEDKLQRAMMWMRTFMQELDTMVYIEDAHDLVKSLEVENIITCAYLCARASSERKESRWGAFHRRIDYPKKDDLHFLKHIILTMGAEPLDVQVSMRDPIYLDLPEEN